jgi:hypothetical protein
MCYELLHSGTRPAAHGHMRREWLQPSITTQGLEGACVHDKVTQCCYYSMALAGILPDKLAVISGVTCHGALHVYRDLQAQCQAFHCLTAWIANKCNWAGKARLLAAGLPKLGWSQAAYLTVHII